MGELDELVAAVVKKLPAPGKPFAPEAREAWLTMMAMAFNVAYGPADNVLPFPHRQAYGEQFTVGKPVEVAIDLAPAKPEPPKRQLPRFLIDEQGIARLDTGERIMPSDVLGPIYDLRGELGDLGAIVWADGARGVVGLHLDISTSA